MSNIEYLAAEIARRDAAEPTQSEETKRLIAHLAYLRFTTQTKES